MIHIRRLADTKHPPPISYTIGVCFKMYVATISRHTPKLYYYQKFWCVFSDSCSKFTKHTPNFGVCFKMALRLPFKTFKQLKKASVGVVQSYSFSCKLLRQPLSALPSKSQACFDWICQLSNMKSVLQIFEL